VNISRAVINHEIETSNMYIHHKVVFTFQPIRKWLYIYTVYIESDAIFQ